MEPQHVLAAFGLVACVGALVFGVLPPRARARVQHAWHRTTQRIGAAWARRSQQRARAAAAAKAGRAQRSDVDPAREAADLIERARKARPGHTREGNVIRPDALRTSRRPDEPLH